jgi:hypothetical protein
MYLRIGKMQLTIRIDFFKMAKLYLREKMQQHKECQYITGYKHQQAKRKNKRMVYTNRGREPLMNHPHQDKNQLKRD